MDTPSPSAILPTTQTYACLAFSFGFSLHRPPLPPPRLPQQYAALIQWSRSYLNSKYCDGLLILLYCEEWFRKCSVQRQFTIFTQRHLLSGRSLQFFSFISCWCSDARIARFDSFQYEIFDLIFLLNSSPASPTKLQKSV